MLVETCRPRSLVRSSLLLGLTLGLLGGRVQPVQAESALETELKVIAKDFKELLDRRDAGLVAVGDFTPRQALSANSGSAIQKTLAAQLQALGVKVAADARFEIQGSYQTFEDPTDGLKSLKVTARLLDPAGETVLERHRLVYGDDEHMAFLLNPTGNYPANANPARRAEVMHRDVHKPQVALEKVRIRSTPDSLYALEIHIKRGEGYEPREAEDKDGRAFVHINKDEVFAVLVVNDSEHEAAVALALDGLSMFAFSANKDYLYLFIPAKSTYRIDGWHLNNKDSRQFVVRGFPERDGDHLKLKDRSSLGVITATFAIACKTKEELDKAQRNTGRNVFIDQGEKIGRNFTEVRRFVGSMITSISVRYTR